jgi:hypothetical protein
MPALTQFDAISPLEFRQWCEEATSTQESQSITELLDLIEAGIGRQEVAAEEALRMLSLATQALAEANERAALEVF